MFAIVEQVLFNSHSLPDPVSESFIVWNHWSAISKLVSRSG
jgi:hypothetical protein